MITLTSQPSTTQPVPVSDCIRWCLTPDSADVFTTVGSKALLQVTFPTTVTVPSNGTAFTVWGHAFTVNNASDFTASSFKATTSGLVSAGNFAAMFKANLFFIKNTKVEIELSGPNTIVRVRWNTCGVQSNFSGANMTLTAISGMGATVSATNGVEPVLKDGYQLSYALMVYSGLTAALVPITSLEAVTPLFDCTALSATCFDFVREIRSRMYTPLPPMTASGAANATELNVSSMYQQFALYYGWVYRQNCQPISGTFKQSGGVNVLNAALGANDPYGIRRYWPGASGGFPPGQSLAKPLSNRPWRAPLRTDSRAWTWFLHNNAVNSASAMRARFFIARADGTTSGPHLLTLSGETAVIQHFNICPAFIQAQFSVTLRSGDVVSVFADATLSGTPTGVVDEIQYTVLDDCGPLKTEIYFLNSAGGIDTMLFDETDEIEVAQDWTEVCIDTPCAASREWKTAYGGRSLSAVRSYKRISLLTRVDARQDWIDWFSELKASPQRWVKQIGLDGQPYAAKLLVESGGIKVFKSGAQIEITVTGALQDTPIQSGAEPAAY